jgi:hypothetical protein
MQSVCDNQNTFKRKIGISIFEKKLTYNIINEKVTLNFECFNFKVKYEKKKCLHV